jgi:hypothetical protein
LSLAHISEKKRRKEEKKKRSKKVKKGAGFSILLQINMLLELKCETHRYFASPNVFSQL